MKKTLSALIIAGIFVAGCASKGGVKATEQPQSQKQAVAEVQKQTNDKPADKKTSQETVASKERVDSMRLIKDMQAKMKDIHFDFDRYSIRNDEKPILKQVAAILRKDGNLKVTIEGNCDQRGTTEYNLALGDKRASTAREFLLSLGVESGRMDTVSNGKEKPICADSNEGCWAKNRRDHFVLDAVKR